MRDALSESLVRFASQNEKFYLLTGDHGYALFNSFRESFPERFINAGVAEQNMVGVAAGLSKVGYYPVIYGLSAFVPIRVLEQIKIDLCYENLSCLLIGDGAGVVYGHLGTSHQSTEDIACLRPLPNITILSPCDRFEMESCFALSMKVNGPVYLRVGKSDLGDIYQSVPEVHLNSLNLVRAGENKLAFVATGSMVSLARRLADMRFQGATVFSAPCIKPFSVRNLKHLLGQYENVCVFEEHSVYGGLGSAFSEFAAENGSPKVIRIGINDRFSEYCGSYSYLMKEHGLDFEGVLQQLKSKLGK